MKFYFVRHGESAANIAHIISNRSLDHPLTDLGRQQARQLAQSLAQHSFAAVYCSPIQRAVETACILTAQLGGSPILSAALREPDMGILEGRSDAEAGKLHNELYQRWWLDQEDDARIEGGESFSDVKRRFLPFMDELIGKYAELPEAEVLLVGHGGLYLTMLPLLLKNISTDFAESHTPGFLSVIIAENRVNGLTCLSWGGLSEFTVLE
jgi:probable phosphoglycerate mutase